MEKDERTLVKLAKKIIGKYGFVVVIGDIEIVSHGIPNRKELKEGLEATIKKIP